MKLVEMRTLSGANLYHSKPVLVAMVDLGDRSECGSHQMPEFVKSLVERLPGLREHTCSPGRPGGFLERLERGTYLAHITEHVALELSELAGIGVRFGKSVFAGREGHYRIVVRFQNETAMKFLLGVAVDFVNALLANQDFALDERIAEARRLARETTLGPSAQALADAATQRGIPWRRIGDGSLLELGYGRGLRRVQTAVTSRTSLIATDLVQDKELTKQVLRDAFLPVPDGGVARTLEELLSLRHEVRGPWVVKPVDGHHGDGVSLNLKTEADLAEAFERAREHSSSVILEQMVQGRDFRILVVNGKLVAAAERRPAHVVGDGERTVKELIALVNQDPRRGEGHQSTLTQIEWGPVAEKCLRAVGLTAESIVPKGQTVFLAETANLSTGGTARDVTDEIHPELRRMCERAARISGLDVCGLDLIHHDIREAPGEATAFIEINAGPGLRMHLAPSEGRARDVAGEIIDSIYPESHHARIPLVGITGTNGKTTTTRMIAHALRLASTWKVGMTSSDGIDLGGERIASGDMTGPKSARVVLSDPSVDAAVLEVARGGLLRGGLGYDWSDVGVITNIRPDHLGQDGIESIEDLVKIKSIVAEQVRDGGTLVLNADDHEASRIMDRPRMKGRAIQVVYYSMRADHPLVLAHLERGGRAVFVENGFVVDARGTERVPVLTVDLPCTMNGRAEFQVSNLLASFAAATSLGLDRRRVAEALAQFDQSRNEGRLNVFRLPRGYFILDYGHNPDALSSMARFLKGTGRRVTAILGLPGDRRDELILESGTVAAKSFDRLLLRDDWDLRGRAPGEVPELLRQSVLLAMPGRSCRVILDEREAVDFAVRTMADGEVIVHFYDKFSEAREMLLSHGAELVTTYEGLFEPTSRWGHVHELPLFSREHRPTGTHR